MDEISLPVLYSSLLPSPHPSCRWPPYSFAATPWPNGENQPCQLLQVSASFLRYRRRRSPGRRPRGRTCSQSRSAVPCSAAVCKLEIASPRPIGLGRTPFSPSRQQSAERLCAQVLRINNKGGCESSPKTHESARIRAASGASRWRRVRHMNLDLVQKSTVDVPVLRIIRGGHGGEHGRGRRKRSRKEKRRILYVATLNSLTKKRRGGTKTKTGVT